MKKIFNFAIISLFFLPTLLFPQEKLKFKSMNDDKSSKEIIELPQEINDQLLIKNESGNSIITFTDEGDNAGSITLPPLSSIGNSENKIYNLNGSLYWGDQKFGSEFSLPYSNSVNFDNDLFEITNTGLGRCGYFRVDNPNNNLWALDAWTNGSGDAIKAQNVGTGNGARFEVTNENGGHGIYALTYGKGAGGHFEILNPNNSWSAVSGRTIGNGNGGYFSIQNQNNINDALFATSDGMGSAARFTLNGNGDNSSPALYVSTVGQGPGIQAKTYGSGPAILAEGIIDMVAIRIGTDAPAGKVLTCDGEGYGSWQDTQSGFSLPYSETISSNDPAFLIMQSGSGNVARFQTLNPESTERTLYIWNNGLGEGALFELDNINSTSSCISGLNYGAGSAGSFVINSLYLSPINNEPAVRALVDGGLGSAGDFRISQNNENTSPAIYASTSGTGPAIQAKPFGSGPAILAEGLVDMDAIRVGIDASSGLVLTCEGEGYGSWQKSKLSKTDVPTSTEDSIGDVGDTSWDDNYLYIKTEGGWKRIALGTF